MSKYMVVFLFIIFTAIGVSAQVYITPQLGYSSSKELSMEHFDLLHSNKGRSHSTHRSVSSILLGITVGKKLSDHIWWENYASFSERGSGDGLGWYGVSSGFQAQRIYFKSPNLIIGSQLRYNFTENISLVSGAYYSHIFNTYETCIGCVGDTHSYWSGTDGYNMGSSLALVGAIDKFELRADANVDWFQKQDIPRLTTFQLSLGYRIEL